MVSRGAHSDDASFLVGGRVGGYVRVINVLLNGIIYFFDAP